MTTKYTIEDLKYNRSLKKSLFEILLKETETFYIHCVQHSKFHIGNRGLKEQEKKEGIILVFGPYSYRKLNWDDAYIYCEMNFGKWESLQIPYECIFRIFDKAGHFIFQFITMELSEETNTSASSKKEVLKDTHSSSKNQSFKKENQKIIKVDFNKKKKKQ